MPLSYGSTIVFQVPSRLIVFLLAGSAMTGFAEICANRVVLTKKTTPASSRILPPALLGIRGRKYKSKQARELSPQTFSLAGFYFRRKIRLQSLGELSDIAIYHYLIWRH